MLCDEATSALDPQTTTQVLQLLAEINRELGLTIVLITHEMDVIRRVCDRVGVMDAGVIVELGDVADVFLHPQHPTTRRIVQEGDEGGLVTDEDWLQVQGSIGSINDQPCGQLTVSLRVSYCQALAAREQLQAAGVTLEVIRA